jgi:uncharacterized protein (DUF488 family)
VKEPATAQPSTATLFTIGFKRRSAEDFFETLRKAGVVRVVDVRLNNGSQLAGFTKKRDLEYFLRAIAGIQYFHEPQFAPTKEILSGYRNKQLAWEEYEQRFLVTLQQRDPGKRFSLQDFDRACLLCSEPTAEQCHRRLVAEYLKGIWDALTIQHL